MPDAISPIESNNSAVPNVLGYMSSPVGSTAAVVWCRLLALCMLGWGLQSSLIGLVQGLDYLPRAAFDVRTVVVIIGGIMLPGCVWFLLAWYCWAKAPSLADRIARDCGEHLSPHGMSADELLSTLMIGIGIYLLTEGLPVIGRLIYTGLAYARNGRASGNWFDSTPTIISAIVRCLLGLWLILGTRGIVKIIRRHGGRWRDQPKRG